MNTGCVELTSDELRIQLETMVDKMPAFPQSVQRILQLTADLNCPHKELVQIIEHDPVITVKILKLLNSAYYNLPHKITSIKRSVVYIGFNTIKNLALSIASVGMLPKKNGAGFDSGQFLLHSLSTAAIAKKLGGRINEPEIDKTDCFVGGLIHDFGKIVFAQYKPDKFSQSLQKSKAEQISLHEAELEIIGADHGTVGSILGEKWQFTPSLIECIGAHHDDDGLNNGMRDCVVAANQVSKKLALGHSGHNVIDELPGAVSDRFGMGLDDLIDSLGDIEAEREEIKAYAYM